MAACAKFHKQAFLHAWDTASKAIALAPQATTRQEVAYRCQWALVSVCSQNTCNILWSCVGWANDCKFMTKGRESSSVFMLGSHLWSLVMCLADEHCYEHIEPYLGWQEKLSTLLEPLEDGQECERGGECLFLPFYYCFKAQSQSSLLFLGAHPCCAWQLSLPPWKQCSGILWNEVCLWRFLLLLATFSCKQRVHLRVLIAQVLQHF